MRKLGKTLSALTLPPPLVDPASGDREPTAAPADAWAAPNHLTELTGFRSNPGALRMFTYVPKKPRRLAGADRGAARLHAVRRLYDLGAGWSTLAERYGFVLLFPEQTAANNPKTCFNWFLPGDTARDRGEALSIRQMIEKTIGAHGVDRGEVFITGLSAGGAMTAAMLATYPRCSRRVRSSRDCPTARATNVQQAFESMFQGRSHSAQEWGDKVRRASTHRGRWPRVSVWHGDLDATVKPMNAEAIVQQWTNVHGIASAPASDIVDGYRRQVWRKDGVDVIESYTITGMAHGTPLATGSAWR